jgi:capsular polysaccharide biosynthesis protein
MLSEASVISWIRRRGGPVLACASACAMLALLIALVLPDEHTAEAVVVVPSGGRSGLSPGEASNLARTYANLIPEDRAILEIVATNLDLDPTRVREHMTVTHDFDTSILRLSFSDPDPAVAIRGSRAIARSIEGPTPVSQRIAPRSISVVAVPNATTTKSFAPIDAAVLGFLLGLVGGSVFVIAWDRADPRIRDAKTLGAEIGCPATSLRHASGESIVALLDRWVDLGGVTPLRVALLAAAPSAEDACMYAAERLVQVGPEAQRRVARIGYPDVQTDPHVLLDVGGAVGGQAAGERLVRTADLIVLVVVDGTEVAGVRHALDVLDQFGSKADWALFANRTARGASRPSAPAHVPAHPSIAPAPLSRPDRWTPVGTVTPVDAPARGTGTE